MLEGHPAIAAIHTIDRDWKRRGLFAQMRAEGGLVATLRRRRYDLVVHLTEHRRGAWLTRVLRPRYSVARHIDRGHWLWRNSFTHYYRLPRATPRHTVECNLDSLRRIGFQPSCRTVRWCSMPGDAAVAARAPCSRQHRPRGGQSFIQIHPGSRWMFKCWSVDNYAGLIDRLAKDGRRLVRDGGADERERALVDAILAALPSESRGRARRPDRPT